FASRRRQTRCYRDWSSDVCSSDLVPDEALAHWRLARERGARLEAEWSKQYDAYRQAYPELAAELERRLAGRLADGWDDGLPTFEIGRASCREVVETSRVVVADAGD